MQEIAILKIERMTNWVMIYDKSQIDSTEEEIKKWLNEILPKGFDEAYLVDRLNQFHDNFDFIIMPSRSFEVLKKWDENSEKGV